MGDKHRRSRSVAAVGETTQVGGDRFEVKDVIPDLEKNAGEDRLRNHRDQIAQQNHLHQYEESDSDPRQPHSAPLLDDEDGANRGLGPGYATDDGDGAVGGALGKELLVLARPLTGHAIDDQRCEQSVEVAERRQLHRKWQGWFGSLPGPSSDRRSKAMATTVAATTLMGAVGPEHWTRVPPNRAVTREMMPAEIIPAAAPRPDRIPKAAPRLRATKLTASPTTTLRQIAAAECSGSIDGSPWLTAIAASIGKAAMMGGKLHRRSGQGFLAAGGRRLGRGRAFHAQILAAATSGCICRTDDCRFTVSCLQLATGPDTLHRSDFDDADHPDR